MLKKILKNPVIGYISSRYGTYVIQFVNSMLIAVYLGPVYLGIWGFINLIIQYASQLNLGIPQAVNTIGSIQKGEREYISQIIGNAFFILGIISLVLGLFYIASHFLEWDIGTKYNFNNYVLYVYFIIVLTYFSTLFAVIFRIYGKLSEIAFSQSVFPVSALFVILLVNNENLLEALVITNLLSLLASNILYIFRLPIRINFSLKKSLMWMIQKRAWYLFLSSSAFLLIIITTRSFVSNYYEVEEFGYFTFSFSLANVILMILTAFTFVIWPKLLNSLSKTSSRDSFNLIKKLRTLYVSTSHLMVHAGVFLFPYFLLLFPQYEGSFKTFSLIALTIVIYTNCFGYQGLLIARAKEKFVGYLGVGTLFFNIFLCYVLVEIIQVNYDKVILATMLSYLFYVFIIGYIGRRNLGIKGSFFNLIIDIFPISVIGPLFLSLLLLLIDVNKYYFFVPLILYILLNLQEYRPIKKTISDLLINPDKINF